MSLASLERAVFRFQLLETSQKGLIQNGMMSSEMEDTYVDQQQPRKKLKLQTSIIM